MGLPAPTNYDPTVFDVFNEEVVLENEAKVSVTFWDSAGSNVFDSIRPISYAHTDCFIICFGIDDRWSFEHVTQRWLPEILKHGDGPRVPIILIANKSDLRDEVKPDELNELVSVEEGDNLKALIGARYFIECSALTGTTTSGILQHAVQLGCMKIAEEEKPANPIWKFQSINVAVVGDTGVGKSWLIHAVCGKQTEEQDGESSEQRFLSSSFNSYFHDTVVDGCEYFLRITEANSNTNDQSALEERCEQADILILCYSVTDPFSFQSIDLYWKSKLKTSLKLQRTLLIGTKSDLKDVSDVLIPTSDGQELMLKLNCEAFIECSAKTLDNVPQLLSTIIGTVKED